MKNLLAWTTPVLSDLSIIKTEASKSDDANESGMEQGPAMNQGAS